MGVDRPMWGIDGPRGHVGSMRPYGHTNGAGGSSRDVRPAGRPGVRLAAPLCPPGPGLRKPRGGPRCRARGAAADWSADGLLTASGGPSWSPSSPSPRRTLPMIFRESPRAESPRSRRADGVEISRVSTAFDYAQAALLLGEQRA